MIWLRKNTTLIKILVLTIEEQIVMDLLEDVPYDHIKTEGPILNRLHKMYKQLMTK